AAVVVRLVADAAVVGVGAIGLAERDGRLRSVAGFVGRREEADADGFARAAGRAAVLLRAIAAKRRGVAEAVAERAAVDVGSARVADFRAATREKQGGSERNSPHQGAHYSRRTGGVQGDSGDWARRDRNGLPASRVERTGSAITARLSAALADRDDGDREQSTEDACEDGRCCGVANGCGRRRAAAA